MKTVIHGRPAIEVFVNRKNEITIRVVADHVEDFISIPWQDGEKVAQAINDCVWQVKQEAKEDAEE